MLQEIEQRTNALHISNEEFQKEIGSYKMEAKGLKEDLIAINRQIVADKREFGELHKNLEELKVHSCVCRQPFITHDVSSHIFVA